MKKIKIAITPQQILPGQLGLALSVSMPHTLMDLIPWPEKYKQINYLHVEPNYFLFFCQNISSSNTLVKSAIAASSSRWNA